MLRDNTPSRLYTSSCFEEDNDHTSEKDITASKNMLKQPLITMSNESLEDEGQTTLQKEKQSRSGICKSLLLGSSTGFALQGLACAAYFTLSKMFGKDTTPPAGPCSLLRSFFLLPARSGQSALCRHVYCHMADVPISKTQSGSLYMRKKFDKDAANPNSGTIWTTQMLLYGWNLFPHWHF
jgi:hypothetical protein